MIVHLETDNPKSINQKVNELILRKLFIKVDDEKIFIDKDEFVDLIFNDVVAIAKADCDMEEALKIALVLQPHYENITGTKRVELSEALEEFRNEIDAYSLYLEMVDGDEEELDIYDSVLSILNSDEEVLQARLYQMYFSSLDKRIEDDLAPESQINRHDVIENYIPYIFIIGGSKTVMDAADKIYIDNPGFMKANNLSKEDNQLQIEKLAALLDDEIKLHKLAISLQKQNAEIPMILATAGQFLKL